MADNWNEWLTGTPEQQAADWDRSSREYRKIRSSPEYQALRYMQDKGIDSPDRSRDPREMRMAMMADTLYPSRTSDAGELVKDTADYALAMGQRLRDTALRAEQELQHGNYLNAASLTARTPLAAVYPPAAAGTPGSPDDWRPVARKNGVPDSHILAFDLLTDPETYISAPVRGPAAMIAPALPMLAGRAALSRADDVLRVIDHARRGRGAATYLVDQSGDVIRRLRNSPRTSPMALEYTR
jgi:hypothetical protein